MKKFKNSILATLLIILTALCLVLSVALYRQTAQSKSEPVESPRGNTIKVPEEEVGRVTIYRDGIVAYEYEGPLLYMPRTLPMWTNFAA